MSRRKVVYCGARPESVQLRPQPRGAGTLTDDEANALRRALSALTDSRNQSSRDYAADTAAADLIRKMLAADEARKKRWYDHDS